MIRSACVRYKHIGSTEPYNYMEGSSHTNCYDTLCLMDLYVRVSPEKFDVTEGFLCDDNRFVDRMEAMKIARKYNQLKDAYKNTDSIILYSYMVNYA